jgi:glycosyltransferase involved in cell wall biosynthesis
MQNHTAELSRRLDKMGARQLILTSRLDGPVGRAGFGRHGQVVRTGVDTRLARQGWALLAAPLALGAAPVDVVHGHCGEDVAVLPLARLAARRHHCPLVITIHASVRHNMRVTSARTAWLRLAGGPAERRALAAADMVIALTPAAADRLAGEGIPPGRIRVIPPGYDPDLFATAAPDPFPDLGRPRVGYIGRIAPQKDVGTLISAFGRLTGPACLLIVGDGPGRRAAETQARPLARPVRSRRDPRPAHPATRHTAAPRSNEGVSARAAAIVLAGLTGMGALLVEILTETALQRELDEDVFGRAYGLAFPAAISGIVIGSVIAPGLAALLGGSGALVVVGGSVLAYALAVMRGADDAAAAVPVPQPAVADAVPAR